MDIVGRRKLAKRKKQSKKHLNKKFDVYLFSSLASNNQKPKKMSNNKLLKQAALAATQWQKDVTVERAKGIN